MGSFSWKLARKWTQGVLLEICIFSHTCNIAGKSQEVLNWPMQKYVKWWSATGNRNYFPTTFMLLNAAAAPAASYWGQEARLLRLLHQRPRVPSCQRRARGAAVTSGLQHQPLVPGRYLLRGWVGALGRGGWDVSFRLPWEFLVFPKQGVFFLIDWLGKLSKWETFKTLCVFMWIYKIKISLNIYV